MKKVLTGEIAGIEVSTLISCWKMYIEFDKPGFHGVRGQQHYRLLSPPAKDAYSPTETQRAT